MARLLEIFTSALVLGSVASCRTERPDEAVAARGADAIRSREACSYGPGDLPATTLTTLEKRELVMLQEKIQHIVVVVQENRSFDHLYGHEPRTRESCAITDHGCLEGPGRWVDRTGGAPMHARTSRLADPAHHWAAMHAAFAGGAMDDFFAGTGPPNDREAAISYYLPQDHPFYSWLVSQYAVSDAHYAPVLGPTWPNRDYLVWGTSFGMTDNTAGPPAASGASPPRGQGIFTQLGEAGVSWKLYWSQSAGQAIGAPYEGALGWNVERGATRCSSSAPDAFCTTPRDDFDSDASRGALPSVAFVESSEDEHPGDSGLHAGEDDVRAVVSAVMRSPHWSDTLVIITYDEGGGFFDHKPPPRACDSYQTPNDFTQRGMRVPLLVVSPYAKRGWVSHQTTDHSSVLRLLQARWNLPALGVRDANASALLEMLDFTGAPAPAPSILPGSARLGEGGDASDGRLATSQWTDARPEGTHASAVGPGELGLKFTSTLPAAQVVGVKYWVGELPETDAPHVGRIWDMATGALLASVSFPEETEQTRSSWQTAYFERPLAIEPNHPYVASRNTHRGGTPSNVDASKANVGVRARREGEFPTTESLGTNYWVDVLVK